MTDSDLTTDGSSVSNDHTQEDLRALARSSTLSLVGMIAKGILGFALVLIVTRGLGPRGAGFFFSAVAFFTILSALKMGADTGLVRSISRLRALGKFEDLRATIATAIYPVAAITTVLAAVILALAPWLASVLLREVDVEQAAKAIRLMALFLPLSAVSDVIAGGTRGFGTVVPYVGVESFGKPMLRPILVWIVLAAGMSSLATVFAWALPIAFGLPILALWLASLLRQSESTHRPLPPPAPRRPLVREFWAFSLPQGGAAFLQTAVRSVDILLVGAMRSTAEAGIYAAVSRTVLYGLFAIDALRIAIAPQISELIASGSSARTEALYRIATWWLVISSWPIYLTLGVFAPAVMGVYGPGFASGEHALLILSIGMLISTGTGNVTTVLLMSGHSGAVLFDTAAALIVDVGLNLLLIPKFGIEGAAVAWVFSIATGELLALWQVWRHLRIDPFGIGFGIAALGSVCCYGGLGLLFRFVLGASLPAMLLSVLTATAAYSLFLFRFRSRLHLAAVWQVLSRRAPSSIEARPSDVKSAGA